MPLPLSASTASRRFDARTLHGAATIEAPSYSTRVFFVPADELVHNTSTAQQHVLVPKAEYNMANRQGAAQENDCPSHSSSQKNDILRPFWKFAHIKEMKIACHFCCTYHMEKNTGRGAVDHS